VEIEKEVSFSYFLVIQLLWK